MRGSQDRPEPGVESRDPTTPSLRVLCLEPQLSASPYHLPRSHQGSPRKVGCRLLLFQGKGNTAQKPHKLCSQGLSCRH